jgi:hypothetical protein
MLTLTQAQDLFCSYCESGVIRYDHTAKEFCGLASDKVWVGLGDVDLRVCEYLRAYSLPEQW